MPFQHRRSPALTPVSAPLSSTPLSRLIYILTTLSILLISYYSYRALQYKSALGAYQWNPDKTIVGSQCVCTGEGEGESVEDRINGLARVLGVPTKVLASVVADVVREHVQPTG